MSKIDIKIYARCKDPTLWDYLNGKAFYSNSINHRIFIPDYLIDEIIPFLFLNRSPIMLIIDTFFFKFARKFSDKNMLNILRHGVNFCLSELLNIPVEIFPKQRDVFTFHEYLYEPYFLVPSRMALEKGAIRKHQSHYPQAVGTLLLHPCSTERDVLKPFLFTSRSK
jgi:hypothetical protein